MEAKFNEAPTVTRSMKIALKDLTLEHLWVLYPGTKPFPMDDRIGAWPLEQLPLLSVGSR